MKKKSSIFIICIFTIVLISYFIIKMLGSGSSESKLPAKDFNFGLNFIYCYQYGEGHIPNLNTLSVGNWSTMYINNKYSPIFKVNSNHILLMRGSSDNRVFYYCKINPNDNTGTTVNTQKNTTFSYGTRDYKTDSEGRILTNDGQTFCKLGDYAILFTSTSSPTLRSCEWVKGSSNWRYYDYWGLTNTEITDRENGFPNTEEPKVVYNLPTGVLTMNGVSRNIKKVSISDENAQITTHPFVFNVTNDTSYRFWVDSNTRTTIPNDYIYDSIDEHMIWPEYNAIFTGDDYSSGNVGVDVNNVGTYVANGKKVDVNLRVTFYWQPSPVRLSYSLVGADHKNGGTRTYTFNQFPRFVGIKVSKGFHRLGLPTPGTPYRAQIDFLYIDETGEHSLALNGSFGIEEIDGCNYIGIKTNSDANIDEIQVIEDTFPWEWENYLGTGSINSLSLGLNANDNSGVYDVICTNLKTNAPNASPTSTSAYNPQQPNYYSLTSNNGFESRVIYNISNLSQMNAVVGGHGQSEYGRRFFNTIFDKPNIFTQVYATENNVYTNYALEYIKEDSNRDRNTNTFYHIGCINISGVQLGRNAIPTPTIMLKDENDVEGESIVLTQNQNGVLNPYTEVVRVKIPYEEVYTRDQVLYDNYYDSFKIEQQLEPGITPDLTNISIHYLGDTTNLTSTYFTTSYDSDLHKLNIIANTDGSNSIYKQPLFYESELVMEIPLAITAEYTDNMWNSNIKQFEHTVSLVVTRYNGEYPNIDPQDALEEVTNTSDLDKPAIAKVYIANVIINKDGSTWNVANPTTDMMNVALYANNVEEYSFSDGVAIDNNSAIRWVGVEDKTYNVYASKNSNEKTTLVDTGETITPNDTQ